ncbi:MAG: nucleotidyltransferase domain-containing protein [Chloroflexota bacterium]
MVLFGSKARGDSPSESDLDLLVVLHIPLGAYRPYWTLSLHFLGCATVETFRRNVSTPEANVKSANIMLE